MTMTRLLGWARCSGVAVGLAAGVVVGLAACGDSAPPDEPTESVAALLCGSINLGQPDAQTACAEGPTTTGIAPNQWATLTAQLCNIDGIPAAGLNGATCTDSQSVNISVTELGNQRFTTALVVGSLTDPNTDNPFAACQNTGAGNISVTPAAGNTNAFGNAGPFVVTQETADFVFGTSVQLPNQCAIAITDGHDQQILVNVGFQIGVDCANSACSAAAVIRPRAPAVRTTYIGNSARLVHLVGLTR